MKYHLYLFYLFQWDWPVVVFNVHKGNSVEGETNVSLFALGGVKCLVLYLIATTTTVFQQYSNIKHQV